MSADGITDGKIRLNCSVNTHGVTLQSPPHPYASYTLVLPTSFGGPGDVLTSPGTNPSQLVWTTPTTGTVTGTGTTNTLPIWTNGGAGELGDSILDQLSAAGVFTDTHLSVAGSGGLSTQNLEINKALYDGAAAPGADGQVLTSSTQGADQEVRWVNASTVGDTYTLQSASTPGANRVPIDLTAASGAAASSILNLVEGTGITLAQTSATEITISGSAQGVTGSGTSGKLPKFDTATSLDDSIVTQTGGITTIIPLNDGPSLPASIQFSPQTSQFSMPNYATYNTVTGPAPQVGDVFNFVLTSDLVWAVGGGVIPAGTYPFTITFVSSGLSCSFNSYTIPASASGLGYTNLLGNGSSTGVNTAVDALSIDGELSMATHKIINVVDPTDAQDAATKAYVDASDSDTTYTLAAGAKTSSSVPLNLSPSTGSDTTVNLTEGTGITLTQTSATEITIEGTAQGVTGSGTVNQLPKFGTTTSLVDSIVKEIPSGTSTNYTADNAFFQPIGTACGSSGFNIPPIGASTTNRKIRWVRPGTDSFPTWPTPNPLGKETGTVGTVTFQNNNIVRCTNNALCLVARPSNTYNIVGYEVDWNNTGDSYAVILEFSAADWATNSAIANEGVYNDTSTYGAGTITSLVLASTATGAEIEIAGELDMTSNKVLNVLDPVNPQDAATKAYVDTTAAAGVTSVGTADADLITIAGTGSGPYTGAVTATANTSAVTSISTNLATGSQIQTAIDTALAGTLTFKGTFNAATGAISSPGSGQLYTGSTGGIAITKGDFYIADTAGSFYGTTAMNVGDEAIALNTVAAAPPGSTLSDWSVVPAQSSGGTVTGTGAATQVTFWDGTSNVNGDTAFNWDNTNKRLGIGTNIPDKNLHVEGASAGVKIESTSSSLNSQLDLKSTTTTWSIGQNIFLANTGTLEFYNGTAKLVVDTSGKVGIGVTTPDTLLHIMGASSGAYIASTINNTNVNGYVKQDFQIGTSHASISYAKGLFFAIGPDINDTTTPIVFRNNNAAEKMRISSSGAIKFNAYGGGTNTGTAAYSLAVDSSGNIIEEAAGGDISGSGNGSSVTYFTGIIGDTGVKEITSNPNIVIDSTGRFGIGTDQPSHDLDVRNVISPPIINLQDANLNSLQLQVDPLQLTINKIQSNIDLALNVNSYDAIKIDQVANVMIGDLNNTFGLPTSRLHVIDEFATDILTLQSNTTNQKIKFTDTNQPINDCFIGSDNGDLNVWLDLNGVSTPSFSFNKTGKLGVGTNLPNYNVDIQDVFNDANLQLMSQNTGQNLVLSASSSFGLDNTIDSGNGGLQFRTNSSNILNLGTGTQQGYVKFNEYGQGNKAGSGGTGVPTYSLLVDSVGEIIEGPVSSGGGTIIKESFSPFVGQINYDLNPLGQNNPQDENYVNIYIDGVYQNLNTIAGVNTVGVGASAMTTVTMVSGAPAGVTVEIVSTI